MMEEIKKCPVVLYTAPDGTTQLDVKLENETVWLSVEQMAMLFDRDRSVIGKHIRNAFREGELIKERYGQNLPTPLAMVLWRIKRRHPNTIPNLQ